MVVEDRQNFNYGWKRRYSAPVAWSIMACHLVHNELISISILRLTRCFNPRRMVRQHEDSIVRMSPHADTSIVTVESVY